MINHEPLIDILMATYNGAAYVSEQIQSIQSQDYKNWRLLIRDDGSKDGTCEILQKYAQDRRIVVIKDGLGNLGVLRNFEALMVASDAPYIAFSDQDDVWLPWKLSATMDAMLNTEAGNPGLPVLVHTDAAITDSTLRIVRKNFVRNNAVRTNQVYLMFAAVVQGSAALINRALKDVVLPLESVYIHDRYIHLVAEAFGKRVFIDRSAMLYRQHAGNVFGSGHNSADNSFIRKFTSRLDGTRAYFDPNDRTLIETLYSRFKVDMPPEKAKQFEDYLVVTDLGTPGKVKKILLLLKNRVFSPKLFVKILIYRRPRGHTKESPTRT